MLSRVRPASCTVGYDDATLMLAMIEDCSDSCGRNARIIYTDILENACKRASVPKTITVWSTVG